MSPRNSLYAHRKCLIICGVVAMANMQYGLDSSAVGALQVMPGFLKIFGYEDSNSELGYGIDSTVQQLITSLLTLGSFVSSLLAGAFSMFLGRRPALWLACILNAAACIIQIMSTSANVLYIGRLLLGFANGFFVTHSNVYTAEVAPAHLRGLTVALFAYWVNVGSILGTVVDYYTKDRMDKLSYQIPLSCLFIVPTFLFVALFFVPESPRWLLRHGKEPQAREALERLRGSELDPAEIEIEWVEMVRGVEQEMLVSKNVGFLDMFRGTDFRRTILCYALIACQAASGIWFLIGYNTYFYSVTGVAKPFQYSIMNTCLGFIGVNFGMFAIRNLVGRRSILLIGALGCGLSQLAAAIAASINPASSNTLVALTALFMFFYNGCIATASYLVATELVSSRLRAWTVGSATSVGSLLAWLTNFCTPYFINPENLNWGAKYGYIWAGSNFLVLLFVYFCIPELKDRTLEEVDELFAARISAREFIGYKCMTHEDIVRNVKEQKTGAGEVFEIEDIRPGGS
ncbi:general substrate transporter [Ilyonectria robusta]|uniref:general substrate transporter n=1 Tax=Ilyonectria robusta TaxID=1079257 RepID=UPI001E8D3E94|nr:general substrate transporter [Ilyonectria robusta]KAH8647097.1 general substrate transporter [Ilyonectria robusta]